MKRFFNRIWVKILEFWYLTVMNTRQRRIEAGGFVIDFHQYDMRIRSVSGNFSMRIRSGEYSFGYLVSAVAKGKEGNIHGYAAIMYIIATEICRDDKFRKDLQRAIERYEKRLEGRKVAEENEEMCVESVRKDLERGAMGRRQRRRAEREYVKEMKQIVKEDGQE